jgi:hypothetical protein
MVLPAEPYDLKGFGVVGMVCIRSRVAALLTRSSYHLATSNSVLKRNPSAILDRIFPSRRANCLDALRLLRPLPIVLAIVVGLRFAILPNIVSRTRLTLAKMPIGHHRVFVEVHDGQLGFALETFLCPHLLS